MGKRVKVLISGKIICTQQNSESVKSLYKCTISKISKEENGFFSVSKCTF